MWGYRWSSSALAVLALAGCGREPALTDKDRTAEFAADLGPATIDVFLYPEDRRAQYAGFKERCSRCHTLARPINAPFTGRQEWQAYVDRMNKRSGGVLLAPAEAERIVDFLVFDAQQRKSKPDYQAAAREREALFARVRAEKEKRP